MTGSSYTKKQMGDACEMLVAGELTLAGIPAQKMPDNWPGYDLVAQPPNQDIVRISVKSRTFKLGAAYVMYNHADVFEWLAIVILPAGEQKQRRFFIIPRSVVNKSFNKQSKTGDRDCQISLVSKKFAQYENNFSLETFTGEQ